MQTPRFVLPAAAMVAAGILVSCGSGGIGAATTSPPRPSASPPPAATPSPAPTPTPAVAVNGDTVTVVGSGSVTVKPDTAFLSIGVNANRGSVADAIAQMNADAGKLNNVLIANGVARDDIMTDSLSISPYSPGYGVPPQSYTASTGFSVRVRDISRAGILVSRAAAAVGNDLQTSGVSFNRQDTSALLAPATAAALANAQAHAAQWAKQAGRTLGALQSMSEVPRLAPAAPGGGGAGGIGGGVVIDQGTWTYTLQVTVVYALS